MVESPSLEVFKRRLDEVLRDMGQGRQKNCLPQEKVEKKSCLLSSPRLASPLLASPRLASPLLASPRLASPRLSIRGRKLEKLYRTLDIKASVENRNPQGNLFIPPEE
ncbi:hypothetical protein QYF61_012447, partial [Mycteria americana]